MRGRRVREHDEPQLGVLLSPNPDLAMVLDMYVEVFTAYLKLFTAYVELLSGVDPSDPPTMQLQIVS